MAYPNGNGGIIYAGVVDRSTGDVGFGLAGFYPAAGPMPVLSTGGLAVDSTSTYLYSSAGNFQMQDGTLTAIQQLEPVHRGRLAAGFSVASVHFCLTATVRTTGEYIIERPGEQRWIAHARSGVTVRILGQRNGFERRYTDSHQSRDVD